MALSPEAIASIRTAIQSYDSQIGNLQAEIDKARRAGLDVSQYTSRVVALQDQVRKLKLNYPEATQ